MATDSVIILQWILVVVVFFVGVSLFCQGHAIIHGRFGYRHSERERKKLQDTRKQIEKLLKDK
mgnify:CR=1 FL=1|jgi:hypothetical protein|tara:strand:- start:552 stop:740 length:189 start_codon:yes stop_codon:yes gene_type:complete